MQPRASMDAPTHANVSGHSTSAVATNLRSGGCESAAFVAAAQLLGRVRGADGLAIDASLLDR